MINTQLSNVTVEVLAWSKINPAIPLKKHSFLPMCMFVCCVWVCTHVCVGASRDQERLSDSLELSSCGC